MPCGPATDIEHSIPKLSSESWQHLSHSSSVKMLLALNDEDAMEQSEISITGKKTKQKKSG